MSSSSLISSSISSAISSSSRLTPSPIDFDGSESPLSSSMTHSPTPDQMMFTLFSVGVYDYKSGSSENMAHFNQTFSVSEKLLKGNSEEVKGAVENIKKAVTKVISPNRKIDKVRHKSFGSLPSQTMLNRPSQRHTRYSSVQLNKK
ncbi:MAG: hypothetical protein V4494_00920 [Chlamydiota bacterium]